VVIDDSGEERTTGNFTNNEATSIESFARSTVNNGRVLPSIIANKQYVDLDEFEEEEHNQAMKCSRLMSVAILHGQSCPICLSDSVAFPCTIPCGHIFCGRCLRKAFTKTFSCPVCQSFSFYSFYSCFI
jgi:RNA polymerase subunit RPABC4/transcription elongation factor Spt4